MSKFAIGEKVEKQPTTMRTASSLPCSQQLTATFGTPSIWKGTVRSSFSPRKIWSFTPTNSEVG